MEHRAFLHKIPQFGTRYCLANIIVLLFTVKIFCTSRSVLLSAELECVNGILVFFVLKSSRFAAFEASDYRCTVSRCHKRVGVPPYNAISSDTNGIIISF